MSAITLFFCVILFSCKEQHTFRSDEFKIRDDAGIEVRFDSIPKRIISLAPNITETLYSIGADSLIVGVSQFCDYPPEAKLKQSTGSYLSPDYETMASLSPDLIILNVANSSNPIYQALKNMNIKLFISNAENTNDIYKMINDLGRITNRQKQADSLIVYMKAQKKILVDGMDTTGRSAFVLVSVNPLMTTNGKTFINDILQLNGLRNIYAEQQLDYPNINYEDVISRDPELIIFPTDTNDVIRSQKFIDEIRRQLHSTRAVKDSNIILVDQNLMFRPGPRVTVAVEILNEKLHQRP